MFCIAISPRCKLPAAALAGRMAGVPVLCKAAMADHRSDLGEIEKTGASGRLVAWLVRTFIQTWVATTAAVEEALSGPGSSPETSSVSPMASICRMN